MAVFQNGEQCQQTELCRIWMYSVKEIFPLFLKIFLHLIQLQGMLRKIMLCGPGQFYQAVARNIVIMSMHR